MLQIAFNLDARFYVCREKRCGFIGGPKKLRFSVKGRSACQSAQQAEKETVLSQSVTPSCGPSTVLFFMAHSSSGLEF